MIQTKVFYELSILFENWKQNRKILTFYINVIQPYANMGTRMLNEQKTIPCKGCSVKYTLCFIPSLDHSKFLITYYLKKLPCEGSFIYFLANLSKIERKKQIIRFTKRLKCPTEPFAKIVFEDRIELIRTLEKTPIILLKCHGLSSLVPERNNFIKSLNKVESEIRKCECSFYRDN